MRLCVGGVVSVELDLYLGSRTSRTLRVPITNLLLAPNEGDFEGSWEAGGAGASALTAQLSRAWGEGYLRVPRRVSASLLGQKG